MNRPASIIVLFAKLKQFGLTRFPFLLRSAHGHTDSELTKTLHELFSNHSSGACYK